MNHLRCCLWLICTVGCSLLVSGFGISRASSASPPAASRFGGSAGHFSRLQSTSDESSSSSPTGQLSNEISSSVKVLKMPINLIGKSTSIIVAGSVFLSIAYYRDAITFSLFIGSVSNGIFSKILKRILNQSRPAELETSDLVSEKPEDMGMPSSHAMSLGFIFCYAALNVSTLWIQVMLVVYAVLSLVFRVQAKLHTTEQVLVGSVFGSLNGYAWWRLTVGDNPWNINVGDWITANVLDQTTGLLPWPMLAIPLVVGGLTVGSFERKIKSLLFKKNE